MKPIYLLIWMSLCLGGELFAQESSQEVLTRLGWLEGRWERLDTPPAQTAYEVWERTDNGFRGKGVTLQGRDTVFVETLSILQRRGTWYYVAEVSHNPEPTYFEITEATGRGLECENPEHDFPKRIRYRLQNGGMLEVIIMGEGRSIPFKFRRISSHW